MLWLIGQIALFLLIAALIGFIIGWLLRTVWPSNRDRTRQGELEAALERAGSRISDLEAGLRSKRVAATAAADPPLEPPGVRVVSHGFRVGPHAFGFVAIDILNSGVLLFPITTNPASR